MEFGVWGLLRVWGWGVRVCEFRVSGLGFEVLAFRGLGQTGLGLRVWGNLARTASKKRPKTQSFTKGAMLHSSLA